MSLKPYKGTNAYNILSGSLAREFVDNGNIVSPTRSGKTLFITKTRGGGVRVHGTGHKRYEHGFYTFERTRYVKAGAKFRTLAAAIGRTLIDLSEWYDTGFRLWSARERLYEVAFAYEATNGHDAIIVLADAGGDFDVPYTDMDWPAIKYWNGVFDIN